MNTLLEFGRGPLFKFAFAIMILGLLRIIVLALVGMGEAMYRAGDKNMDFKDLRSKTIQWLFPFNKWATRRPVFAISSIVFHAGLILVPLFLAAHILLWKQGLGIYWPAMPQFIADMLTVAVIVTGPALFVIRIIDKGARAISRKQDYMWPLLLTVPAFSGFLCVNFGLSSGAYQFWMLLHIFSANLILILMPFTKIAHCILMPVTQFVSGVGWKFPVGSGEKVADTLGKKGQPI